MYIYTHKDKHLDWVGRSHGVQFERGALHVGDELLPKTTKTTRKKRYRERT